MKQPRGFWYWWSFTNIGFLIGSRLGLFGRDAEHESQAALEDMSPLAPVLVAIVALLVLVLAAYLAYTVAV